MWNLVECSLPETMTLAERGRLADSLATIMNIVSRHRVEKDRKALEDAKKRHGR